MDRVADLLERVKAAKAERESLLSRIDDLKQHKQAQEQRATDADLARALIIRVAEKTQLSIGERISDLVGLALGAVFDNPYGFGVDFIQRRGGTEADLCFIRDGEKLDPMSSSGGGAIDIASFALRLAVWTLARTRPLFILDEPFRNLSLDLQGKAGMMLQELSRRLGVQIIMVSHNPEIISGADKVFTLPMGG